MVSVFIKNVVIPVLLRFALAAVFIYHGYQKVGSPSLGADWMPGPDAQPAVIQLLVAWGELVGGLALAVGFLTRVAALGIIVIMAGAIATVHLPQGFALPHGYEYNFVLIIVAVCLVLGGPGPIAIDRVFRLRKRGP